MSLVGCANLKRTQLERIRNENEVKLALADLPSWEEEIDIPTLKQRPTYPWEAGVHLPKISKDMFRCKGEEGALALDRKEKGVHRDCHGYKHGLPMIRGQEGVYPVLVDLLNFVQRRTGRRVIVTCGHRCPIHNTYADPSLEAAVSKHQIGAEVDFYVQGMEARPLEIIALLMQYYLEHPVWHRYPNYTQFVRYQGKDTGVTTAPWMNQEIYIKLYQKGEGRDLDNQHPHPYVSIQVRYDTEKKERIVYSWDQAHNGYLKSRY
jgi:hypothetical protein